MRAGTRNGVPRRSAVIAKFRRRSQPQPAAQTQKLFEALLRQLEGLARGQPVLMVFEDAHWIDPTSRELLDLTVERVPSLPVLLVVTFRPEFQPPWTGQPHVTMLALNRLGRGDGAALVERLAGNAGLPHEIVDEIVERTDGVPLFVEELTKAVLESADRDNRVAAVLADEPAAELGDPGDTARLADGAARSARPGCQGGGADRRGDRPRVLLRTARSRSRSVPRSELASRTRPARPMPGFCSAGVRPPHASYLFKHALVQDAAYATLLRGRRQQLHAAIAAALEGSFPELVEPNRSCSLITAPRQA